MHAPSIIYFFLATLLFLPAIQAATLTIEPLQIEPWGKEADLAKKSSTRSSQVTSSSFLKSSGKSLIWFHKNVISPADGPRSHHKPNSSQYTIDAIDHYGFFQGFLMGCDRLMRENSDPWIYPTIEDETGLLFKWDPVR